MFEFLKLLNYYGDSNIITYLKSYEFSDNDDIMRLLDVNTTGLTGQAKSKIDFIQTQSKLDSSEKIPRVFLQEIELELEKKIQQSQDFVMQLQKHHKTKLTEKDAEIDELKTRNQQLETRLRSRHSEVENDPYLADTDCMANPYYILNPQPEWAY